MANIGGVFIVVSVGILIAVIALGVEYWYFKYKLPNSTSAKVSSSPVTVMEKNENNW